MNLLDSSFLCLDIGTHKVAGVAHRIQSGRITKSATYAVQSSDMVFAIKSLVDEMERQCGTRFDSAHITGNFGAADFQMTVKPLEWNTEHRITASDINTQISDISVPVGFYPMHIIPLRYDTPCARNLANPVGHTDRGLTSVFAAIFYTNDKTAAIMEALRAAHITPETFADPSYLIHSNNADKNIAILDLGAEFTGISVWTARGPVFFEKLPIGGDAITHSIADAVGISVTDATRIKHNVAGAFASQMDRFTPADTAYDFSRGDVNDIALPMIMDIIESARNVSAAAITKYNPTTLYIIGGGVNIRGIDDLLSESFGMPVKNMGDFAAATALSDYVWGANAARAKSYVARGDRARKLISFLKPKSSGRKQKKIFIPIMPSSMAFDMTNPDTYSLFKSGDISMIHIDIADGFFVNRITGGIEELKAIRAKTDAHLHVHLMTESPTTWAAAAASAGADTIIVSTNTAGVRGAIRQIQGQKKRAGIALGPDNSVEILKPILKEIDDILIMSVPPGRGGQEFDMTALHKISVLANTRKKYGLKYKIAVDGGINPDTAKLCWAAGADFLISGSYLASAHDFPLAVQSLLRGG